MRRGLYLVTTGLVAVGLVAGPVRAQAQDGGQPGGDAYSGPPSQDPPALVGRLAQENGSVSYHGSGQTQWTDAVVNTPMTDGDAYWTQPQAQAELEIESNSLWMDGGTEFDVNSLEQQALQAALPQGNLYAHLRETQPGQSYSVQTPRGTVTLNGDGRYEIVAGDTSNPTVVTVLNGQAQVSGPGLSLEVSPGQTATITGDGSADYQGSVGPAQQDTFLQSMISQENPPAPQGAAPPPVVAEMTGGEDLNAYGSWQQDPSYGDVWYPSVGSDWAPYREGRWSYVAPWGWTWIDAEPWGFAPFHYGRWVQVGPRWGWVPQYAGYDAGTPPVYAPALVTFFGIGAALGVAAGLGFGLGLGAAYGPNANVGWVPLGPREPYFPPYAVSRSYISRVNVTNIRNVTTIYNQVNTQRQMPISQFANARAATVVPAGTMANSRPVASSFRRPAAGELTQAHGLVDRAPIAPTAHTAGLTPAVAQQLHVPVAAAPRAPGPRITPHPAGEGRAALPPLRPAAAGAHAPARAEGVARPGEAARPEGATEGRPALRAPGESPVGPHGAVVAPRPGTESRPAEAARPGVPRPEAARPQEARPQEARPEAARPEASRPEASRPEARPEARPVERPAPRPEPRPEARPAPRPEVRPEAHPAPRPEPPKDDKKPG
jgi:hypothetical protein